MLHEFIETLDCITTHSISPLILSWLKPIALLCLVDRSMLEVKWHVPLVRFRGFYPLLVRME
jgi:hypothetical protein